MFHHIDIATTNITFEGCLVEFDEDFEQDVLALPYQNSTSSDIESFTNFLEKYGTSYISSIILGGRAKKIIWLSQYSYGDYFNRDMFFADTSMPLLFQGGDKDYIDATPSGNLNKYNAWKERLKDFSEIIEIKT